MKAHLKEIDWHDPLYPSRPSKTAFYFEEEDGNGVTHFLDESISLLLYHKTDEVILTVEGLNGLRIVAKKDKRLLFYGDAWELDEVLKENLWIPTNLSVLSSSKYHKFLFF